MAQSTAAFFAPGDVDYLKSNIDTLLLLNVGSQQGGLLVDGQIMAGERDEQDPDIDLIYQKVNALIAAGLAKDVRDYITDRFTTIPIICICFAAFPVPAC